VLSRSVPRFLLQAGLLIGVAAVAAILHLDAWAIVIVMAAAFAAVVLVEWLLRGEPGVGAERLIEPVAAPQAVVRFHRAAPNPEEAPLRRFPPPTRFTPAAAPAASPRKPLAALPPTWPRAKPPPQPSAALASGPGSPPPSPAAPPVAERRHWNVFDLQNGARQIAGTDPARDEELSFLLLYLREFADVSGDLSEDFDTFVRESFPELVALS
jgi:hypothetical protein